MELSICIKPCVRAHLKPTKAEQPEQARMPEGMTASLPLRLTRTIPDGCGAWHHSIHEKGNFKGSMAADGAHTCQNPHCAG